MTNHYLAIASEIRELENLLATIPEGNVIERMSLESRLESARAALAGLPQQSAPKARLTFRGKPVFGSHGIAADFGGKAADAFSDAFAAVQAYQQPRESPLRLAGSHDDRWSSREPCESPAVRRRDRPAA